MELDVLSWHALGSTLSNYVNPLTQENKESKTILPFFMLDDVI